MTIDTPDGPVSEVAAGTPVTTTATFKDESGALVNPTTVMLKFLAGSLEVVEWVFGGAGSITNPSEGLFSASLDTTPGVLGVPGPWKVEWIGVGQATQEPPLAFVVAEPEL